MWLLDNETPFSAERTWTRDERGAEFWLVAIRAAFEIDADGRQRVADEQTEVQRSPIYGGDPVRGEMLSDCDFALSKTGTDVLVAGKAHAPGGRPTARSRVRLKVADIDKTVDVVGDRTFFQADVSTAMTRPEEFTAMPLSWSRAFGGWDDEGKDWVAENPAGRGFAAESRRLVGGPAPNFEYPDAPYRSPRSGRPAGFGPVAHHWQPRVGYGGTYDKEWEEHRDPLLPDDFDRRYFRCAPADQQTAHFLIGYEEVRLGGFSPDGPLGFVLPRIVFDVVTRFRGGADVRQVPDIHTLWIHPDRQRFELVYQSALEVPPGREERLVGTTILLRPRIGVSDATRGTGVWIPA
jgi:hypothetical protein